MFIKGGIFMYKEPNKKNWEGRIDDLTNTNSFRFHQAVILENINQLAENENAYGIIGFECDEGVKRNKGRLGASKGPNEIKKKLAQLSYNIGNRQTIDVGNIVCENSDLEYHQKELANYITYLMRQSTKPIILGGGHETLYAHYLGVKNYIGSTASLGIINIDAHLDLRNDSTPSSGTMFNQIMEQDDNAGYLCLGVQQFSNTHTLFERMGEVGGEYILEEDLEANNFQDIFKSIDIFAGQYDHIILTLDADSIISSAAPGVSAPSPLGLDPKVVRKLLRYIVSLNNLTSFDISEVNPLVDENEKTTKLAANLVAEALANFRDTRK